MSSLLEQVVQKLEFAGHDVLLANHLSHRMIEREEEGIGQGLWRYKHGGTTEIPTLINNEYYAWC